MPYINDTDDADLRELFAEIALECDYRQVLVPSGTVGGSLNRAQPVGTAGAEYSTQEAASEDSTVNAATGMTGGFAPPIRIRIIFAASGAFNQIIRGLFGLEMQETQPHVFILAGDVIPSRGDLIDHPNGTQYVVGQDQSEVGLSDRPLMYFCAVEHRAANSVTSGY